MSEKIACSHGCGKTFVKETRRDAARPLDKDAVDAANKETWSNCRRLTNADGTKRELTMDPEDSFCRRVWMDAYIYALNRKHKEKAKTPTPSAADPTCPVTACPKAKLEVEVTDYKGKPIKGALVDVTSLGGMFTKEDGFADYGEVIPSLYAITAEKEHFLPAPNELPGPARTAVYAPEYETTIAQLKLHRDELWCTFDAGIRLDVQLDNPEHLIPTPLRIHAYDELKTFTNRSRDYVTFLIQIQKNTVEKLDIEITSGKGSNTRRIFTEELQKSYCKVGTHEWTWDGYSNAGILETKVLKDPDLRLELRAELCGVTKTSTIKFNNAAAEVNWVDVIINRPKKNVSVEVRVDLEEGEVTGVGELPPAEVWEQSKPNWSVTIPVGDPRRERHTRVRSFSELKNLALSGLKKYWSRNVGNGLSITTRAVLETRVYTVDTTAISVPDNSMDDIKLRYLTNTSRGKSMNPGTARGGITAAANVLPEWITYNVGWIKFTNGWFYVSTADADADFEDTAAHEIGHEILSAYGGGEYSYTHHGTTTLAGVEHELYHGGENMPKLGEIDLMKYYADSNQKPKDFYDRLVATEEDVASLIWLARVRFRS